MAFHGVAPPIEWLTAPELKNDQGYTVKDLLEKNKKEVP